MLYSIMWTAEGEDYQKCIPKLSLHLKPHNEMFHIAQLLILRKQYLRIRLKFHALPTISANSHVKPLLTCTQLSSLKRVKHRLSISLRHVFQTPVMLMPFSTAISRAVVFNPSPIFL